MGCTYLVRKLKNKREKKGLTLYVPLQAGRLFLMAERRERKEGSSIHVVRGIDISYWMHEHLKRINEKSAVKEQ